jgi:uncharacterized NAD(P)/FAD-binding protein YdhS
LEWKVKVARIGIIGMGPRGLTVLERIVANERQQCSGEIEVLLFDPNAPGPGCHDPGQSDIHLVNTVAGQLTVFADPSALDAGPVMHGPSFFEWLQEQGGRSANGLLTHARASSDAYYARGLFGRYLMWAFRYICALAPPHVKVILKRTTVQRAHRDDDGAWVLDTLDATLRVSHLFLTTGHTKPARIPRIIPPRSAEQGRGTLVVDDPYPIATKLSPAAPGMVVAVEGMGLTTFDVLGELTLGRGGQFVSGAKAGEQRYIRSGREPKIIMFCRSGIPLSARAVNQKGVSNQYRARFLLIEKLRALRAQRKLDFHADVLPLLLADMEYAYYDAYFRERRDAVKAVLFCNQLSSSDPSRRQALIARHVPAEDRLSWDQLAAPVPEHALAGRDTFHRWLIGYLQRDVCEAGKGNVDSPLKAACDVLRDLRDNLRAAIEFGGLNEASHRWVLAEFMPVMNRLAVGPPSSRISEMLALMEAGVLEADYGPGAVVRESASGGRMHIAASGWAGHQAEIDVLVKARVSMHSPVHDASKLLQGLLQDGYVRPYYNGSFHPGGIEIDRRHNWVAANGSVIDNAWALGIPTEGIKFCTFVIPRPGVNSTALVDAGRAVAQLLASIRSQRIERPAGPAASLPTEAEASAYASLQGAL